MDEAWLHKLSPKDLRHALPAAADGFSRRIPRLPSTGVVATCILTERFESAEEALAAVEEVPQKA